MRFLILRAALAAAFFATTVSSFAGTLGIAGEFNGFVFGDLTAFFGQDTEGRLAVGGNLTASNYSVGFGTVGPSLPLANPPIEHLVVGGNLNAIDHWQVFNGNAAYGGTLVSAPSYNCVPQGCATHQATPVDFAAAEAELLSKSAYWATLPANGDVELQFGVILQLTGTDPVLNVFNVSAADLAASVDTRIDFPSGATALVNVFGMDITYQGGMRVNGSDNQANPDGRTVLFNFPEALTVSHNHVGVIGSVLAPQAFLTINSGGINGVGIAAKVHQQNGGEFHNFTFDGELPDPVPEPTTVGLLLIGAVAACGACRRRA